MSSFLDWLQRLTSNSTTTTDRRTTTKRRKKIKQLRKQLRKVTRMLQNSAKRTRKLKREGEFFDDFFTSAFSHSHQPLDFLTTAGPMSTVAPIARPQICGDIRGRDRACCNSAVTCFDDLKNSLDEIGQAENDFSLLSACRRVSSELKKDKQCVKQAVSRCDGPGRAVLLRRFDNRISKLYDQFYRHCTPDNLIPSSTTTTEDPAVVTNGNSWTTPSVTIPPQTISGHSPKHGHHPSPPDAASGSIAIIAGAIAGGIFLIIVLLIALVLWCRSRDKMYDSNGTSSSSAGIFFQKKPNIFSTDRPRDGNGKRGLKRQESSDYAEIDERFMNPGFRLNLAPPLPGEPPLGYLRPISEAEQSAGRQTDTDNLSSPPGTPDSLKDLGFSPPPFATRGQLKYGSILAAANANGQSPVHPSSALKPDSLQKFEEMNQAVKRNETSLSVESFDDDDYLAPSNSTRSSNRYISMDSDHYELPNSERSSVNYDQIEQETGPKHTPPVLPSKNSDGPHRHSAVKVLPSNPLTVPSKGSEKPETNPPVAKPRRKKQTNSNVQETSLTDSDTLNDATDVKNHSPVVSTRSNASSHHYFVLEPHLV